MDDEGGKLFQLHNKDQIMSHNRTFEEKEQSRLEQIENEAKEASKKIFKDEEFLGIKDEYFEDAEDESDNR